MTSQESFAQFMHLTDTPFVYRGLHKDLDLAINTIARTMIQFRKKFDPDNSNFSQCFSLEEKYSIVRFKFYGDKKEWFPYFKIAANILPEEIIVIENYLGNPK